MPIDALLVVGAGGHAKVVIDAWSRGPRADCALVVIDENPRKTGRLLMGHHIAMAGAEADALDAAFHVAIGDNTARARLHRRRVQAGGRAVSVMHPAASIARSAFVGDGGFVAALSVVAPDARIGCGSIVNHGAVVDHDCIVGSFSHIGPNAALGGGVIVGSSVLIGAGVTVLPGVRVGDGAIIAAGSTIVRDVEPGETVIFTQVRKMRKL